jgi:uncharacterized protein (TIGR00255 family)
LPTGYTDLEERVRGRVYAGIGRGRVEIRIQVEDTSAAASAVEIDMVRARAVLNALALLKTELGLDDPPSLALLVEAGGILKTVQPRVDVEAVWPVIEGCLIQALNGLEVMRSTEGRHLAHDLEVRIDTMEAALGEIGRQASGTASLIQERLRERIAVLTQGVVDLDPSRIAQEAAFLADRADISEEIVRATSHLKQFRSIMNASEPGGRQLNFLLQELNREFNTMGSKIGNAAAAHVIVAVKAELERIREQIQNVE